ncbi:MAG: BamA/TamA family outer membrane protein [Williamsia sp.]|nr:BamA/TamA family outer membrane protein [Williamsia sp.]
MLLSKGYPAASVDSVLYDSASAFVALFVGEAFRVAAIKIGAANQKELQEWGWQEPHLAGTPLAATQLERWQQGILEQYEENGYPFAKLHLDSIGFEKGEMTASLAIDKGPLYKIDSIHVVGGVKIANRFLQRYLEIADGSIYRKSRFGEVSKKLLELPYLQEERSWDLTLLGTGSILNLYLKPKRSSQANVLVGFLPANDQLPGSKLLVTGEAAINLRNALGNGETIGVNWQQIQPRSPRLNLLFQQPYLGGSPFGISTSFDLLKKDSLFLNLNFTLGLQYALTGRQSGRIFLQTLKTNLLTVDTILLKAVRRLPDQIDVSSVNGGIDYELNTTNYRFNPLRGNVLQLVASAGLRKLKKNNVIVKLADPSFSYASLYDSLPLNSYQFRLRLNGEHYFKVGKQSTLKTALNAGWFESPSPFRNELFQIGGYKLLRGFDEESIYASRFAVGTAEYRFLIGINSYLFSFVDAGWVANKTISQQQHNRYLGAGAGLAFETKAGIFNISLAVGKRDDDGFNLRQAKIHLGYATYF